MEYIRYLFSQQLAEKVSAAIELPDAFVDAFAGGVYSLFGSGADAMERMIANAAPGPYKYLNDLVAENIHPMATKLPLMNIWHVLYVILGYFVALATLYVVGKAVGKGKYRLLGIAHNFFLHTLSLYMSVGILVTARAANYTIWNNGIGSGAADWRMAKLLWLFYISKVPEFMDTFLMVLKHNYRQVTFLHLYHHTSVFIIWFICTMKAPGGEAYWSAMVNASVHVVMYGYYMLTMLFEKGAVRSFLNNLKFIITKGQMTQFALNCVQSVFDLYVVPREALKYNAAMLYVLFWYMITLLILFGNFLLQNQGGKARDPSGPSVESHSTSPVRQRPSGNGAAFRTAATPVFAENSAKTKNGGGNNNSNNNNKSNNNSSDGSKKAKEKSSSSPNRAVNNGNKKK